ncbi:MAG: ParB N-terminal domain-containing protein [Methanospirillum sp.]|nr:ParB N-terminal domain-containing protein [Methanospirillum sp.]
MIGTQAAPSPVGVFGTLPISSIRIKPGRRPLNETKVGEIAESIPVVGLINPITVSADNVLIAGLHRVEAFNRLGLSEIPAIVFSYDEIQAKLAEVLENSARSDLSELAKGQALLEAKTLYEAMHPETKRGAAGAAARWDATGETPVAFTTVAAKEAGKSDSAIFRSIQIAKAIAPDVQEAIAGTDLADSKKDLLNLARIKDPEKQREVARKVLAGEAKDVHTAYLNVNRAEKLEALAEPAPMSTAAGSYNVILADPPWRYEFSETSGRKVENHYPTMDLADIAALEIPADETAILFLWTTAPKLEEGLDILRAWGFTYKTCAIWDKLKKGLGYYFRVRHEILLVGTRGDFPTPAAETRPDSVFSIPKGEHSAKPEIVHEMIEAMYPKARRLEVFARAARPGWEVWGNEVS